MTLKFSNSFNLPDYLEEALAPFTWPNTISESFRNCIVSILMANDISKAVEHYAEIVEPINPKIKLFVEGLIKSLRRYARENGENKKDE